MASVAEDRLLELLKTALQNTPVDTSRLRVCRKTRDLAHGDFVVPRGVLDIDLQSEAIKTVQLEELVKQATAKDDLPIATVKQDSYNALVFHVDRCQAHRNIIQRALSAGESYGSVDTSDVRGVVVNAVDLHKSGVDQSSASLTQLRAVVLLKHVLHLLKANGHKVETAQLPTTDSVQDLLSVLGVDIPSCTDTDLDTVCQRLTQQAQASPHRDTAQSHGQREGEEGSESVVLNARTFMEAEGLRVGKHGFDKNLHLVNVQLSDGSVSEAVRTAAVLDLMTVGRETTASARKTSVDSEGTPTCCVHIVSQSLAYTQQQADLVWRMCSPPQTVQHITQHHLVFGTVGRRKSSTAVVMDAREFYNVRHRQMTQAAMMKYGDHDQGEAWDDMICGLTAASITFDLLTTACSSQVQLDLSDDDGDGGVDNRSGPFVLYNCARLASLLHAFQQQVEQGVYPALPEPNEVDFTLLREEEEWTIAFLYIHGFPYLVEETLHNWQRSEGIAASVHTHKVSHFLINFSKTLSSYYSRYHILGGGEAHLLPVMFARLSLMKAAHLVLCNGLRLLGLQPFSQL